MLAGKTNISAGLLIFNKKISAWLQGGKKGKPLTSLHKQNHQD
jgi:hypothetical protein